MNCAFFDKQLDTFDDQLKIAPCCSVALVDVIPDLPLGGRCQPPTVMVTDQTGAASCRREFVDGDLQFSVE